MQDYFTDKGKTDILRSTRTGLWEIILRQGREPVMHADSVMLELLGLDAAPEPEECYQVRQRGQAVRLYLDGQEVLSGNLTPLPANLKEMPQ